MKIIIGIPFANEEYFYNNINIGLGQLVAVLKEYKYNVKFANFSNFIESEFISIIKKERPDVIGFRCLTPERHNVVHMLKLIKNIDKNIITILGGPHPSILFKQMLTHYPEIDFIIIGEGEYTLLELVEAIKKKKDYRKIPGIAFLKDGIVVQTKKRESIKNIDTIPPPVFEYDITKQKIKNNKIFINTCRGCPRDCTFCSSNTIWGRNYRVLSIKEIIKRIKFYTTKYKTRKIHFCDDTINSSKKRIIDLCKSIIDENLNITWSSAARVDKINEDIINWMKKSGCTRLEFGVESGCSQLREKMKKNITNNQIIQAFSLCKKAGIKTLAFIMWGYPGENLISIFKTIKLLLTIYPSFISTAICSHFPGTELSSRQIEKGKFSIEKWIYSKSIGFYVARGIMKYVYILINYSCMFFYNRITKQNYSSVKWNKEKIFEI